MALGKRLINTGAAAAACTTDSTDPFGDSSGVALYSLDYDASDASGSYDGTPTDVTFGVGGQINYGARFNGSSSKIITGLDLTSFNSASLSVWIYWEGGDFNPIFGGNNTVGGTTTINRFTTAIANSGGRLDYISKRGDFFRSSNMSLFNTNTWNHIVITDDFTSSSTASKVYVNGTQDTNFARVATSYGGAANTNLYIGQGRTNNNGQAYLTGSLDQVRIFNRVLSTDNNGVDEIATLYAEQACVYTATTTDNDYPTTNLAYYKMDNSAEDEKGSYDGTESNIEYRFGRYGQAAKFPALASSYIDTGITSLGSDFSLSFWFNPDYIDGSSGYRAPLGKYYSGSGDAELLLTFNDNGTVATYVYYGGGVSSNVSSVHPNTVSNGNWYHYCITWENGVQLKTYLNNVAATTTTSQTKNTNTVPLYIGALDNRAAGYSTFNSYAWSGFIDQVRLFSSALTSSQVTELYNEKPEVDTSNFKTVLYEGTGANQYISNVGMDLETSGGLVWIKNRSSSSNYFHALIDSVRGVGKVLSSNTTTVDTTTYTDQLTSLEANGFFVGNNASGGNYVNISGDDYVAWNWKAGGDAVNIGVNSITGSTPSIASDVSANTAAGFSIVKYTPPGGGSVYTNTVAHGLSSAPEIIIQRMVSNTGDWYVHTSLIDGSNDYLELNTSDPKADNVHNFQVTSTTFTDWGWNGNEMINYLFHSVSGYSKIGAYAGNSSTNKITLDFAPSWVMIKLYDVAGGNWFIYDNKRNPTNPADLQLEADTSAIDTDHGTVYELNFLSDGFELQGAGGAVNFSGRNYLYMAFK